MDHKIIYSRRNKYSITTNSELNAALIDKVENEYNNNNDDEISEEDSIKRKRKDEERGERGGKDDERIKDRREGDNNSYDDRTDSITTMRSDMNTYFISPHLQRTNTNDTNNNSNNNDLQRNNTRNNSFYDYVISPYEYFLFCLGFSVSCVPIVVAISFSASAISHAHISGIGNGGFFLGYALCSLSLSKSIVDTFGCKKAILYGYLGSCTFVLSFLVASAQYRPYLYIVYPVGATIGGISQAIMWAAQGKYFTRVSRIQVTSMTEKDLEDMNRRLAEQFAIVYLRSLIIGFGICTIMLVIRAIFGDIRYINMAIVSIWLLVSFYLLYTINDLGDKGSSFWANFRIRRGFYALIRATKDLTVWSRWKLAFLVPYQLAWGCCTSFWLFYILGLVLLEDNGSIAVGVASLVNLVVSSFFTQMTTACTQVSQSVFIILGGISTIFLGLSLAVIDTDSYSNFGILILHSFLYGLSRSVYENNMMAVIANYFPDKESLAYSIAGFNKTVSCGITLLIFAFFFNDFTPWFYAYLILSASLVGVIGYIAAVYCHARERYEQLTQFRNIQSSASNSSAQVKIKTETLYAAEWAEDDNQYSGSSGASTKYSYLRVASLTQDDPNNVMYVPEYF